MTDRTCQTCRCDQMRENIANAINCIIGAIKSPADSDYLLDVASGLSHIIATGTCGDYEPTEDFSPAEAE